MTSRRILILLPVLLVLGTAAFYLQGPGRRYSRPVPAAVFTGLDPAAVRAVVMTSSREVLRLSRGEGQEWRVGEEGYRADGGAVDRALEDLSGLKQEAVASRNLEKKALFGLDDEKGIAVRLEGDGGSSIAEFVVGDGGPDLFSGYLLRRGGEEVLLVSSNLRSVYGRSLKEWRDRAILRVEAGTVSAVTVEIGEEAFTLEKGGEAGWTLDGRAVDKETVEDYIGRIENLRAADFAAPGEAEAAFGEGGDRILIRTGEGSRTLTLGALKEESGQRYLRTGASAVTYLVSEYAADALRKSPGDFPPPAVTEGAGEEKD
jgi:hypothetical protein